MEILIGVGILVGVIWGMIVSASFRAAILITLLILGGVLWYGLSK